MTTTADTRMPLHVQISNMIAREIQSGILADGEKLAPERKLAAHLSISVGTLRKALLELENKGMLNRVHGSGNYVHRNVEVENVYTLFRLQLIEGGGTPSADLMDLEEVTKPTDLPKFGTSTRAFRFRRQRLLGDVPAALEEIWLDASYTDAIHADDVGDSMYMYYKQQLGFWITRAEDRVGVSEKPDWAPEGWPPVDNASCGFVERLSRDHTGKLAEFSRTWFDPKRVQFVSRS